jgi:hypothetical protein
MRNLALLIGACTALVLGAKGAHADLVELSNSRVEIKDFRLTDTCALIQFEGLGRWFGFVLRSTIPGTAPEPGTPLKLLALLDAFNARQTIVVGLYEDIWTVRQCIPVLPSGTYVFRIGDVKPYHPQ